MLWILSFIINSVASKELSSISNEYGTCTVNEEGNYINTTLSFDEQKIEMEDGYVTLSGSFSVKEYNKQRNDYYFNDFSLTYLEPSSSDSVTKYIKFESSSTLYTDVTIRFLKKNYDVPQFGVRTEKISGFIESYYSSSQTVSSVNTPKVSIFMPKGSVSDLPTQFASKVFEISFTTRSGLLTNFGGVTNMESFSSSSTCESSRRVKHSYTVRGQYDEYLADRDGECADILSADPGSSSQGGGGGGGGSSGGNSLAPGVIAGIAVAAVALVVIISVVVWWFTCHKKKGEDAAV